ncbi:hypothetical protein HDU88_007094 [Geranomyces variabilis]|nr:hypothetical protein HDU88_007094 [Geranomyces variabilis]
MPSLRFAFRNREEVTNFPRIPGLYPITTGTADISPLVLPPEWERAVDMVCSAKATERKVLCTVGSKNMGKSTYGRYLVNRLLNIYPKVAFLECDVGQSEFTPSGMISLHVISSPLLGPPFSHFLTPYRSVYVGAISPKCDPDCYLAGLRHLYGVFERDFLQANDFVPLVINTHGWIRGMGLDLLVHFLHSVQPTHIFQLAVLPGTPASGARNVLVDLPAILSGMPGPSFSGVLSEIPADDSYRPNSLSAADLRTISLVSYFHQLPPTPSVDRPSWSFSSPLATRAPYIVPFDSVRIKFLHSEVPFGETLHALNGCIVGLVIDQAVYEQPLRHSGSDNELPHIGKNLRIIPTDLPFLPQNHTTVGIGLIRAVDMEAGTFHVLAGPTPPELLRQVNTFVRGAGFETPIPLLASGFEYPSIAVDYYHPNRTNLRVFLLSHVHADHLNGLTSTGFNLPLYCSEESARLLLRLQHRRPARPAAGAATATTTTAAAPSEPYVPSYRYTHLKRHLRPLRYEEPIQVYVGDGQTVTLTLLNANHCAGSAMFLIEGENGNVLYTGDMRAEAWFVRGVAEYVDQGIIPDLATVYLDTTFCHEDYASFPTRAESIESVICIIRQYDSEMTFKFGYNILGIEPLWERIASVFNAKIFLHPGKFALYSNLPTPPAYITNDPSCTRFHASGATSPDPRTVVIRPSTMRWRASLQDAGRGFADEDASPVVESQDRVWNVLYSIHSSLAELQDLIMVLRPLAVFPCVISKDRCESRRISELFIPYLRPPPVVKNLPAVLVPPPVVVESSQETGDTELLDSSLPRSDDVVPSENDDNEEESLCTALSASYPDDACNIRTSISPQLLPCSPVRSPRPQRVASVTPLKLPLAPPNFIALSPECIEDVDQDIRPSDLVEIASLPRVKDNAEFSLQLSLSDDPPLCMDFGSTNVVESALPPSMNTNTGAVFQPNKADGANVNGAGAVDVIIIAETPPVTAAPRSIFNSGTATLVQEPSDMRAPQERSEIIAVAATGPSRRLLLKRSSGALSELPDWIPDRSRRRSGTSERKNSLIVIDLTNE